MEYFGYIASLIMGIILGLVGGGGSILTVPILVYLFSLSPLIATGYSLFVVGVTSLIGCLLYIRKKEIDFKAGLAFAFPSVIGVHISRAFIIPRIPSDIIQIDSFILTKEMMIMMVFAILMVMASSSMIKKKKVQQPRIYSSTMRALMISLKGLFVGLIAGFVGAGGGFLIIPALVFMVGLPMRIAVGTSLFIIAVQSLLGFLGDLSRGLETNWSLLLVVTTMAVIGIIIGTTFSHKINEQKLKPLFGWFVLVTGLAILIEQIRHF